MYREVQLEIRLDMFFVRGKQKTTRRDSVMSLRVTQRERSVSRSELKKGIKLMYKVIYLYILRCNDGSFYTGVTNNLEQRMLDHNNGNNVDAYTFNKRPLELVYHAYFTDYNLAFDSKVFFVLFQNKFTSAF